MNQVAPGTIHEQQFRVVTDTMGSFCEGSGIPESTNLTWVTESEKELSFSPTYWLVF